MNKPKFDKMVRLAKISIGNRNYSNPNDPVGKARLDLMYMVGGNQCCDYGDAYCLNDAGVIAVLEALGAKIYKKVKE
jgi:hypothetical protein